MTGRIKICEQDKLLGWSGNARKLLCVADSFAKATYVEVAPAMGPIGASQRWFPG